MPRPNYWARAWAEFKAVIHTYPLPGFALLALAFLVIAGWLISALHFAGKASWLPWFLPGHEWAELLAGVLTVLGIFIVAAILIFRRVNWARAWAEFKAAIHAYPLSGFVLLALAFFVTAGWLLSILHFAGKVSWLPYFPPGHDWAEPLAGVLTVLGTFIVAAILIFRGVNNVAAEAASYGVTHALAIGYYFNFVRPQIVALRDRHNALHGELCNLNVKEVVGLVVGLPQSIADCHPDTFDQKIAALGEAPGTVFELHKIEFRIEGHPRPVNTRLAVSTASRRGIFVDIPTTLAVIPLFADFVAKTGGADNSENDGIRRARREIITLREIEKFKPAIDDFRIAIVNSGAQEPRESSPTPLLEFVHLSNLRRRMDELAGH